MKRKRSVRFQIFYQNIGIIFLRAILIGISFILLSGCSKKNQTQYEFDLSVLPKGRPETAIEIEWESWEVGAEEDPFDGKSAPYAWFRNEIEYLFNVSIKPMNYKEEFIIDPTEITLPSEYADIGSSMAGVYHLYEKGIIREIPLKMIHAAMPEYSRLIIEEYPAKWNMLYPSPDNADAVLGLVGYRVPAHLLNGSAFAVRKDWAEKIGYYFEEYEEERIRVHPELPIYWVNHDFTIEEFEKLLVAFQNGSILGDFASPVIPFDGGPLMAAGTEGCFGLTVGPVIENGRLTMGEISKGFYDYIVLMQKWHKLGLFKQGVTAHAQDENKDRVAVYPITLISLDNSESFNSPPINLLTPEDIEAGAEVIIFPPPIGPNGNRAWIWSAVETVYQTWPGAVRCINRNVDDEKLYRILQILEYMNFTDEKTRIYAEYGKPGVHFDWEGEPWESKPIPRRVEDVLEGYPEYGGFDPWMRWKLFSNDRPAWIFPAHLRGFLFDQDLANKLEKERPKPAKIDYLNDPEIAELKTAYGMPLYVKKMRFFDEVVFEDLEIEDEWPRYVKDWLSSGGQALLEAYKKIP